MVAEFHLRDKMFNLFIVMCIEVVESMSTNHSYVYQTIVKVLLCRTAIQSKSANFDGIVISIRATETTFCVMLKFLQLSIFEFELFIVQILSFNQK